MFRDLAAGITRGVYSHPVAAAQVLLDHSEVRLDDLVDLVLVYVHVDGEVDHRRRDSQTVRGRLGLAGVARSILEREVGQLARVLLEDRKIFQSTPGDALELAGTNRLEIVPGLFRRLIRLGEIASHDLVLTRLQVREEPTGDLETGVARVTGAIRIAF